MGAGEQCGDACVGVDGPVSELRVAGAKDDLRVGVDVKLLLEGLLDVDASEDPEALLLRAAAGASKPRSTSMRWVNSMEGSFR